jgi:ABC-type multidrug transport system fused ATPase/permease subunit
LLPALVIFFLLGKYIRQWGKKKSVAQKEMIKVINHSLGSLKDTKVIGCEDYFINVLRDKATEFSKYASLFQVSQYTPQLIIQTCVIAFVIGYISLSNATGLETTEDLSVVISVFAVASIRLIPAVSGVVRAFVLIQGTKYPINLLYQDLKSLEKEQAKLNIRPASLLAVGVKGMHRPDSEVRFESVIEFSNIHYRYAGAADYAIKDLSLKIKKGQSVAFIGKSGAGKTTLVDILLGLLTPESGDIQVDQNSIYSNLRAWQDLIGYIPQSIFLTDESVEQNVAFGVPDAKIDRAKVKWAIEMAQLDELVADLPKGLQTSVGERGVRLSGGQRQRIGIARALYHGRDILVLDEATSALDNETEKLITGAINALSGSRTLIIIAHRLSTIKECDQVYVLNQGRLETSGSYQEIVISSNHH